VKCDMGDNGPPGGFDGEESQAAEHPAFQER